jgi:hypothetical protein
MNFSLLETPSKWLAIGAFAVAAADPQGAPKPLAMMGLRST